MPAMVGKRKRDTSVVWRSEKFEESPPPPPGNAQDVFRKYFEAQFQPLEQFARRGSDDDSPSSAEDDDDKDNEDLDSNSDWDGLSEADSDENQVEVVEHKEVRITPEDMMDKKARKAFMVCVSVSLQ